ncbi:N-methylhydantoinase A/oxoprolinase/acetone carboxylase, beta subunit [Thermanaeromonas toyohensis ToBE]|uniref:N-methylhydantoinase A/oxoprolinase/acetone carboxylase, beta subunit n=1 Tax=Thermanaeromonas toyohensis ToBE TaxID=698762 RepID=A0A1W1VQN8_9FIRM|nr:hydantoinase/oxoprolinase family protein [Thermanaeromonas toyohensis]SMB95401.1 N-methylhydantoinase A/oxoprolinase/acetone carboxylase, beta subunit [Thermanaeromonas toyohensis ToBE]
MYIGLDMGGTHTDAVLISKGRVVRYVKRPTHPFNFLASVQEALEEILKGINPAQIERVNLSTTVCTNAIVEGKTEPVGLLLIPGPGLNPSFLQCGQLNFILQGSIDHRGRETSPLREEELALAKRKLRARGLRSLAIVGKFSNRNPTHEVQIASFLEGDYDFITLGHRLSGRLGFPRRVYTAYLNSAVWRVFHRFAEAVQAHLAEKSVNREPFILKADGGTLTLSAAKSAPVETILSGPAASIMGALALLPTKEDAVILDIGGTTTDVAFCAEGIPLFEPQGIYIGPYPTLVRSLWAYPIGLGGDSQIRVADGFLSIGPQRLGPPACLGGPAPTPTDALVVLGLLSLGDLKLALQALQNIAKALNLSLQATAEAILKEFTRRIAQVVTRLVHQLNQRPVYTVREILRGRKFQPTKALVVGTPAPILKPFLAQALRLPVEVPELAGVANAIGAAISRPTASLTLFADTEQGRLFIPEVGWEEKISPRFTLEDARNRAFELLKKRLKELGYPETNLELEVIEEQVFNVVRGFYTAGKNIRLKVQNRPSPAGLVETNLKEELFHA